MTEKLARDGGTPVRTAPFPAWPVWDGVDEKAVLEALRSGVWGRNAGSQVVAFEEEFAAFQGTKYCIAVVNGTCALELGLRVLDVEFGDEVICPSYTFVATPAAPLFLGAIPVFADIDPDTFELDPASVEAAITPRTKAIIPVHIAGQSPDMDGILAVAQKHNLRVLEDAAQAHGASWRGQGVGGVGDLGSFSFQSSKNLNCGEGGAICTNDQELAELTWSVMNVGRLREGAWYQHERLGWNYRLSEFHGALLRAQLTRVPEQMELREANARYLDTHLAQIPGITPQHRPPEVTGHAHHLYMLRYDKAAFGGNNRAAFIKALSAEGIPCSPGYDWPCHEQNAVKNSVRDILQKLGRTDDPLDRPLPNTDRIAHEEGVWLPQSVLLADEEDMQQIVDAVAKLQRAFSFERAAERM